MPAARVPPIATGKKAQPQTIYHKTRAFKSHFSWITAYIAFFTFIACATAGSAYLQAIRGHDLQALRFKAALSLREPPTGMESNRRWIWRC
jgi:hypothetical protein